MLAVDQLIRFSLVILVITSGSLLGVSLSNFWLTIIVLVTGVGGYVITDRLKWLRLDGLLANIASILILIIAMKDFFPEDSTGKLMSVAHLLIYLQALLMFQEKTPRLVWQILMLSLLQAVVAAIFSLGLEGGVLFILYFVVAGITLTLQMFYSRTVYLKQRNRFNAQKARQHLSANYSDPSPIVFFDNTPRASGNLRTLYLHLSGWLAVSLAFTLVLFYMIPRTNAAWVGGAKVNITSASLAKSLDLLNTGEIRQTNQVIFRVYFEEVDTGRDQEQREVFKDLYFRGMALADLVIVDGHTNWSAPFDRVSKEHYQVHSAGIYNQRLIRQIITMEESRNPLYYSVMPSTVARQSDRLLEYCHEVSALSRYRFDETLELAPFKYELFTSLDSEGEFPDSWPYIPNHPRTDKYTLADDPRQEQWLLKHDPERYPTLMTTAARVADEVRQQGSVTTRKDLCKALESYFTQPGRFTYTLDYRNIRRSPNLDPNEDFVRNHRSGHCEMFASALTLMLRSQDIPSRIVVGYYGGEVNSISNTLVMRGRHAHAWVEAYLRPEDCTAQMFADGVAGPGGAWLRLDPTPFSSDVTAPGVGTEAIDFARNIWQEYVLGMSSSHDPTEDLGWAFAFAGLLDQLDLDEFYPSIQRFDSFLQSGQFRKLLIALIIFPPVMTWLATILLNYRARKRGETRKITIRSLLAKAVSFISPKFGGWLGHRRSKKVTPFYDRLLKILNSQGFNKSPNQSSRDFASFVGQQFSDHPRAALITSVVSEVSEIFNEVRFGKHELPHDLNEEMKNCLDELESVLKTSP